MENTYLRISITYYNNIKVYIQPDVHYYRNDGIHPATSTFNKLTTVEANKLMWELVKLGGKNTVQSNPYCPAICTREVTFWGRL